VKTITIEGRAGSTNDRLATALTQRRLIE